MKQNKSTSLTVYLKAATILKRSSKLKYRKKFAANCSIGSQFVLYSYNPILSNNYPCVLYACITLRSASISIWNLFLMYRIGTILLTCHDFTFFLSLYTQRYKIRIEISLHVWNIHCIYIVRCVTGRNIQKYIKTSSYKKVDCVFYIFL